MEKGNYSRSAFIARSAMWALLFYGIFILATNWDDVTARLTGRAQVTVMNSSKPCIDEAHVYVLPYHSDSKFTNGITGTIHTIIALLQNLKGI